MELKLYQFWGAGGFACLGIVTSLKRNSLENVTEDSQGRRDRLSHPSSNWSGLSQLTRRLARALRLSGHHRLNFQNHRHDQRTARGLLGQVALQVGADFFLHYTPVAALFRG